MYRTIQKVVVWRVISDEEATCVTISSNTWGFHYHGKPNSTEVVLSMNHQLYLVSNIVFELGFQFMGL